MPTRKNLIVMGASPLSAAKIVGTRFNAASSRLSSHRVVRFPAFRVLVAVSSPNFDGNTRDRGRSTTIILRASSSSPSTPSSSEEGYSSAPPQVAVLGGGAAGLTAAYFAATAGARVTIYERTSETGKKILMSGGARCNVLPVSTTAEKDFITESTPR